MLVVFSIVFSRILVVFLFSLPISYKSIFTKILDVAEDVVRALGHLKRVVDSIETAVLDVPEGVDLHGASESKRELGQVDMDGLGK